MKLWETPPLVAVSFAVCAEDTEDMIALNPAVLAPAFTVKEEGTETELLLLVIVTFSFAGVAAVK